MVQIEEASVDEQDEANAPMREIERKNAEEGSQLPASAEESSEKAAAAKCSESVFCLTDTEQSQQTRVGESAAAGPSTAGADWCQALMEVVKMENGKWQVSNFVQAHNHDLVAATASPAAIVVPEVGSEFDLLDDARAYYHRYGEGLGFKPMAGLNRSASDGSLIMQRFLCHNGDCSMDNSNLKVKNFDREVIEEKGDCEIENCRSCDALESSLGTSNADCIVGKETRKIKGGHPCNKEVRTNIVNKYLMKRHDWPAVNRPAKIASRQAVAERRKRGNGGRFLPREGLPVNFEDEVVDREHYSLSEVVLEPVEPCVGMVFLSEDKAHDFYSSYAAATGFNIRKGWWDKTSHNITKSRVFVCSKEGFRPKCLKDSSRSRPERRTGCQAHMTIRITEGDRYVVSEFVVDHNHELKAPITDLKLLKSLKILAKIQPSPKTPKYISAPAGCKNYLKSKRMREIQPGDSGAICEYLQKMKRDSPSFFYAIQVDEDDCLTNVFWADAKSMMDCCYFGDVVCFDTRYNINEYGRPLALFIGVNHHKQVTILGSALIYDESVESFIWLFDTYKSAMCGRQPQTVFTDQCPAIADAIAAVWPGTAHQLSILHLYDKSTNILGSLFEGSETFAHDFGSCMYDLDEEEEFLYGWGMLLEKFSLKNNDWLNRLYEDRERWGLPYAHGIFCADMEGTLRNDRLGTIVKEFFRKEMNLQCSFRLYGKFLEEKRIAEQHKVHFATNLPHDIAALKLLWQAADTYTPAVFEFVKLEFESLFICTVQNCCEIGTFLEYEVTVKNKRRSHLVRFEPSNCMLACSCKKFESVGLPCCHMLKILEVRNAKELPTHLILKRWRKDGQNEIFKEDFGFVSDHDLKSSFSKRYCMLYRILHSIAAKAAESLEAYAFIESQSGHLIEQVEQILQAKVHEKSLRNTAGHQQYDQTVGSNELRRANCKKNKTSESQRSHQTLLQPNKRKKGLQVLPTESESESIPFRAELPQAVPNNIPADLRTQQDQLLASSQLLQASFIPPHIGFGSLQWYNSTNQYSQMQDPSTSALQPPILQQASAQTSFYGGSQVAPPELQGLQFLNSHLGPQNADNSHYNVPVWDFL